MRDRPPPLVNLMSQKMGIHEWSYDNDISLDLRYKVPHRDKAIALRDIKAEVELGFDDKLAFAEAQRCLNCDVQTVFTDNLCIECDACVDICPVDCITFTGNGEEAELRLRLNAPAHNETQDALRVRRAEDGAGDGEGRGCLPALRPVCRTVPHWRVGYAALPDRCGTGGARMLQLTERVEPVSSASTTSSSSSPTSTDRARPAPTRCSRKSILRMGVPVTPRNIFPTNIQGLPTWYEVRVSEAGYLGARGGGVDLMVAMNPQTWDQDIASIVPGGYLFYDNTKPMPPSKFRDDIVMHRRAADRDDQQGVYRIRGSASCSRTSSISARCRRCSRWMSPRSRRCWASSSAAATS